MNAHVGGVPVEKDPAALGERETMDTHRTARAELATTSANIRTEVADAADATVAWSLLDQHEPEVLILVAGANPVMRPLQYQTWETFSVNWHTDVKIAFTSLREALPKPLPPGSRVVVVSSGAAINGSPASGGYAGSKATQRFIAGYAQDESRSAGLDITVTAVMPRMTPFGDVGRRGVRAYAARGGQTEEGYLKQLGELLTPEMAGSALASIFQQARDDRAAVCEQAVHDPRPAYGRRMPWMSAVPKGTAPRRPEKPAVSQPIKQ
ncbi:MAG TPA: SDR family NAD(P)-dependent oxidoreductase [Candidatus Dormibacteraeota bacterium]